MARRIVVTSGKGGVGKTTICANLGYALASDGQRVLLLDGDIGLNNLDVVLGVENKIVYDLVDVITGRCRPKQALIQDFFEQNLYVLPSNQPYINMDIESKLIDILTQLDNYFDYILIDCPAGIETGFLNAIACANEAIVVTTPHLSSIRDADKVASILISKNVACVGVIVNRVRGDLVMSGDVLSIEQVGKYLKLDILGVIPEDDFVACQLMGAGQLSNRAVSYLAFGDVVKKLHYGKNEVFDCTKKYKGIIGGIRKKIRRWV